MSVATVLRSTWLVTHSKPAACERVAQVRLGVRRVAEAAEGRWEHRIVRQHEVARPDAQHLDGP